MGELGQAIMGPFAVIIAIGISISVALGICQIALKYAIRKLEDQEIRKQHDEPEKEKGLPSEWEMRLNRLLDRVLGERIDEKRKNDELADDDEERLK